MKVLLLFTYNISLKQWFESGILNREIEIYKELNKEYSLEFIFLTYGDETDHNYVKELNFIKVVPLYQYLDKKDSRLLDILNVTKSLKKLLRPYSKTFQIIKTNQLNGVWLGLLIKKFFKKPLFVRTGYDIYLFSIKDRKSKAKQFFYYLLTWVALLYCNIYTVSSESDYKFIKNNYLFNKNKLLLRRNWVPLGEIKSFNSRFSNSFLSVGRLEIQKDYEFLINKINNRAYELHIVGSGSQGEYLKSISSKNILFFNKIEHSNLMNLYEDYKFYISSTDYEGNPKSLIEAMSKGCVVIAPNNENILEIIDDGKNGLIFDKNNFNFDSLLDKISSLKLEEISKNAYNFIKINYSINKAVKLEYEDYQKCTDEKD